MSLSNLLFLPPFSKTCKHSNTSICNIPTPKSQNPNNSRNVLLSNIVSIAVAVTLNLNIPLSSLAIPSLNSPGVPLPSPTTPFSQSKNLEVGLENGKIRPCPSTNPGCITTNPKSSSFTFPLTIPDSDSKNAVQKLQEAILKTQKNPKIQVLENTQDELIRSISASRGGRWIRKRCA
ncbi:hypothetical protein AQUCO_01100134v1 [Aquilegia coerulea]|uniref:Uncharacterized protein n=1 Tax=Aquilegia coerulea TaxID=218851 RepID=A0A2G5E6C8_AQUCA|nr:hypothetical protein AQUCO_01100134v1 [Aquilegia coerulea]